MHLSHHCRHQKKRMKCDQWRAFSIIIPIITLLLFYFVIICSFVLVWNAIESWINSIENQTETESNKNKLLSAAGIFAFYHWILAGRTIISNLKQWLFPPANTIANAEMQCLAKWNQMKISIALNLKLSYILWCNRWNKIIRLQKKTSLKRECNFGRINLCLIIEFSIGGVKINVKNWRGYACSTHFGRICFSCLTIRH